MWQKVFENDAFCGIMHETAAEQKESRSPEAPAEIVILFILMKAPVITISASGANAGFVRLYGVDVFASDCSFVDGLGTESLFFVYEFLKESKVSIDQLQKGSAQPHVYAKDINAMKITIPEKEYLERFDRYTKVLFDKIKTLQGQNERLKIARDLLLPKLMSGEVEV